jgi:propionyl-CoA synthetase
MGNAYEEAYALSIQDKAAFWGKAAEDIVWTKTWDKVLDETDAPLYRWFTGGELNTCYNAVDRHVEDGRADQAAIIHDSPITGAKRTITYAELKDQVSRFAGALAAHGVTKGDRVIVYMPMIPESLVAMLACARLGAVHSVVFGGFAPHELATRINDAQPKVIVAASCGIEPNRVIAYKPLLDDAIDQATWLCSSASRPRPSWWPRATWIGTSPPRPPSPTIACPWPPPIPCTSSTPPAPPASPRVLSATTAATPWP